MPYEENKIYELCEKCGKKCTPEELNKELCQRCDT